MDKELKAARRKGIGGSDISKLVGHSNYGGPYSLWADKTGLTETLEPKFFLPREFGSEAEELLVSLWQRWRESKNRPVTIQHQPGTIVVDKILMANIDIDVTEESGEELVADMKTAKLSTVENWKDAEGKPTVPLAYYDQIQWYTGILRMAGRDISRGLLIRFMDNDFKEFYVDFNEPYFNNLVDEAKEFWARYIEGDDIPPIDNSEQATFVLDMNFSSPRPDKRQAAIADLPAITEYVAAHRARKEAEARLETAKNAMKERVGNDTGIKGAFGSFSWSRKANRVTPRINPNWDPHDPTRKV